MSPADLEAIAEAIHICVGDAIKEIRAEFQSYVAARVESLPPGPAGKDAVPVDVEAVAERAAALIKPPRDGKDAPPVDLDSIVIRAAELIPRPENGKDAPPVDTAAIAAEVLRQIPTPEIPDLVEWFEKNRNGFREVVLRQIPVPENGKDAPPVDIDEIVSRAASLVPAPIDGKDAPPVDTASIVQEVLNSCLQLMPPPKEPDTEAIIAGVLKQVPKPQDGRDADPEVVRQLVAAAVTRAVSELPVPKDGEPGKPGRDGESIHPDTVELMVRKAVSEAVASIPKPEPGKPGVDGRDALQIDPFPMIDPARSYPKGSFAYHNGGTLRANRNTTIGESVNMSEWDVPLDGWPLFEIEQAEDLRTFTFTFGKTSGQKIQRSFKLPVVLHRGVYVNGNSYECGDQVQRQGSTWICVVDSTAAVPDGVSKDWILSNKAGRDGKDLRPEDPTPKNNGPVRLK